MNEAVFISDLHLHPDRKDILARFDAFLEWVKTQTKSLYILGDFFHVWAGDDTRDAFSDGILNQLSELTELGINVYFMPGNRDFLLGKSYLSQAKVQVLDEPTVIELGRARVLLVHGDRYCTEDKLHQWFRCLTRARWFKPLFLTIPKFIRVKIVKGVRTRSETHLRKKAKRVDVTAHAVIKHLNQMNTNIVIHGHTHRTVVENYQVKAQTYTHYILSDWDAPPSILCYNKPKGLHFKHI